MTYLTGIRNKLKPNQPHQPTKTRFSGVTEDGIYGCNYRAMYELLPGIQNLHHQDIFHYALVCTNNKSFDYEILHDLLQYLGHNHFRK